MDFLKNTAASVQARANVTVEAKKLLDEGGPQKEMYLSTKGNMRSALQTEAVAIAQCTETLKQYESVVDQINKTLAEAVTAMTDAEKAELSQLATSYKNRIQACKTAIDALSASPATPPTISPVEDDAIKMLLVKGKIQDAQKRTKAATDQAMAKVQGGKKQEAAAAA